MNRSLKIVLYGPQNSCQTIQTIWKYTQKIITAITSIFVPINVVRQPWNACQYSQKLQLLSSSISVHIKCCTNSTNPYGMAFSSLLSVASKYVLLFALGCMLSFSKCCLFSQLDLSLSLSCSLNKNAATFLFLASHQEPLGISPRISCSLNKIAAASTSLALGISPRASWPLTKISLTPFTYPRMGAPTCLNQLHEGRWGVF